MSEAVAYALEPLEQPAGGYAGGADEPPATTNQPSLSPREEEVAALITQGFTNRQIAARLVITEGTAASHVVHILRKLGFGSRAQVAAWAVEHGLTIPAPDGTHKSTERKMPSGAT